MMHASSTPPSSGWTKRRSNLSSNQNNHNGNSYSGSSVSNFSGNNYLSARAAPPLSLPATPSALSLTKSTSSSGSGAASCYSQSNNDNDRPNSKSKLLKPKRKKKNEDNNNKNLDRITNVCTSPSQKQCKTNRLVPLLLAFAVLGFLGNSFYLAAQLMASDDVMEESRQWLFFHHHYHRHDDINTIQDDDVSHHDDEEIEADGSRNNANWWQLSIDNERELKLQLTEVANLISSNLSWSMGARVNSCRYVNCHQALATADSNTKKNATIAYYNAFPQARYLCGKQIEPKAFLKMSNLNSKCGKDISRSPPSFLPYTLFPVSPIRENQNKQKATNASLIPAVFLGMKGVQPSRSVRYQKLKSCDVQCYALPNNLNIPSITRTVVGTPFEIVTSMEGPMYYKNLNMNINRKTPVDGSMRPQPLQNRFFATTSFQSSIPMPYFSWDDYAPDGKPIVLGVDFQKAIRGAVFMAKNCQSTNQRETLVHNLMTLSQQQQAKNRTQRVRIDSVSKCLHNHDPPPTQHRDDKIEILKNYMFYLAFENQNYNDYITEKIWHALFGAGSIPVYYGAPNIKDHVPPHSVIHVKDFGSEKDLYQYLVKVASNQTLYDSYHAWRRKPLPEAFVNKYNFTHVHSSCRMCRWAFAKQYGYAWDHPTQQFSQETSFNSRRVCWDNATGLLVLPFEEEWTNHAFYPIPVEVGHSMCGNASPCQKASPPPLKIENKDIVCEHQVINQQQRWRPRTMTLAGGTLRRTVWVHDNGVLDLFLEQIPLVSGAADTIESQTERRIQKNKSVMLILRIPFLRAVDDEASIRFFQHQHQQFWWQTGSRRFTLLTKQPVTMANPNPGIIQLFLKTSDNQRQLEPSLHLRILVEDLETDLVAQERIAIEEPTYFANLVAQDFLHPFEKFLVEWGSS